jgi:hypothetical protein
MSIEEATVSNMWEIAAIVEVLDLRSPSLTTTRRLIRTENGDILLFRQRLTVVRGESTQVVA